jgi:hypothetical protein
MYEAAGRPRENATTVRLRILERECELSHGGKRSVQPKTCRSAEIDRAGRCASDRQEDLNSTRFRSASTNRVRVVIRLLCGYIPQWRSAPFGISIRLRRNRHLRSPFETVDEFTHQTFDYVVTLCDNAERFVPFLQATRIALTSTSITLRRSPAHRRHG